MLLLIFFLKFPGEIIKFTGAKIRCLFDTNFLEEIILFKFHTLIENEKKIAIYFELC